MNVKGLLSEKGQSPCQRELLSPTENTAPALPEPPGLVSSLYNPCMCPSLCNRCYINMYIYVFYKIYTAEVVLFWINYKSLDHTTLLGIPRPTLPLIGYILPL